MSRKTKPHPEPHQPEAESGQPAVPEEAAVDQTGPSEAAAAAPIAPPTQEETELAALRRQVQELQEKNLRLLAETQNLQKRAHREKQEALRFAEAELARELLVVLDDLERVQESARTASDAQAVADGVRIVYEQFIKVLKSRNIEAIQANGQIFDPAFHEAVMQQPSDEHPAGTVVQELARGYLMHHRVLRPSRVIVSSGPAWSDQPGSDDKEE
jgi:molecular chaperone GrpE